eukprot:scaffold22.g6091.t1
MEPDIPALVVQLGSSDEGEQLAAAAGLLSVFSCCSPGDAEAGAAAGAIPALVLLLGATAEATQEDAAGVLVRLCFHSSANCEAIAASGALPPLVRLLDASAEATQEAAARALAHLCCGSPASQDAIAAAGAIPALVRLLGATLADTHNAAAGALASICCDNPTNQEAIAAAGSIPPLVRQLRRATTAAGQEIAARALANACADSPAIASAIAHAGAIPLLVRMLGAPAEATHEAAAWALARLCYDSPANREPIAAAGAIPALVRLLGAAAEGTQTAAAWALTNVCYRNSTSQYATAAAGAIPTLQLVQCSQDKGTLHNGADILSWLELHVAEQKAAAAAELLAEEERQAAQQAARMAAKAAKRQRQRELRGCGRGRGRDPGSSRTAHGWRGDRGGTRRLQQRTRRGTQASSGPLGSTGAAAAVLGALSEALQCPITQEPMCDPVLAADGHMYERAAIEAWITREQAAGRTPASPMTAEPLEDLRLVPVHAIRGIIGTALILEDVEWALAADAGELWAVVRADPSLGLLLDTFLRYTRRPFDDDFASLSATELSLWRLMLPLLHRLLCAPEPGAPSRRERATLLGSLLTLPAVLDACALYGAAPWAAHELRELAGATFALQPRLAAEANSAAASIADNISQVAAACQGAVGGAAAGDAAMLSSLRDGCTYLRDTCLTLCALLRAAPGAAGLLLASGPSLVEALGGVHGELLPAVAGALGPRPAAAPLLGLARQVELAAERLAHLLLLHGYLLEAGELTGAGGGAAASASSSAAGGSSSAAVARGEAALHAVMALGHREGAGDGAGGLALGPALAERYGLGGSVEAALHHGRLSLDEAQLDYLAALLGLASLSAAPAPAPGAAAGGVEHGTPAGGGEEDEVALLSQIQQVQDLLPDYGAGFLAACLRALGGSPERVLDALLEGSLPPAVAGLDQQLSLAAYRQQQQQQRQGAGAPDPKGKRPVGEPAPAPGATAAGAGGSTAVGMGSAAAGARQGAAIESKTAKYLDLREEGYRESLLSTATAMQYEYEDEYDDSFDDLITFGGDGVAEIEEEASAASQRGPGGGHAGADAQRALAGLSLGVPPGGGGRGGGRGPARRAGHLWVLDGKVYNYAKPGAKQVASQQEAQQTIAAAQAAAQEIHGLGAGGNVPLPAAPPAGQQGMGSGVPAAAAGGRGPGGRGPGGGRGPPGSRGPGGRGPGAGRGDHRYKDQHKANIANHHRRDRALAKQARGGWPCARRRLFRALVAASHQRGAQRAAPRLVTRAFRPRPQPALQRAVAAAATAAPAPHSDAPTCASERDQRLEVLVQLRKLYRNLLRSETLLQQPSPVYQPPPDDASGSGASASSSSSRSGAGGSVTPSSSNSSAVADADGGAPVAIVSTSGLSLAAAAAEEEEQRRIADAVDVVAELQLTAEELKAGLRALRAAPVRWGTVFDPSAGPTHQLLTRRAEEELPLLPFVGVAAAQAALDARNARYRLTTGWTPSGAEYSGDDADSSPPASPDRRGTLGERLEAAERVAEAFVTRRLQPAVARVRETSPQAVVKGVKSSAVWARDLWRRLNGGGTGGVTDAPQGLPLPTSSEEARKKRIAVLHKEIDALEDQLQEASKARESRLRRAGIQGRARVAAELRGMDSDVAALSKALAVKTLELEMEFIYDCLEDEALDIVGDPKSDKKLALNRRGSSDEVALLIAEFRLLDEQLSALSIAAVAAAAAAASSGKPAAGTISATSSGSDLDVELVERGAAYIDDAELARLALEVPDLRVRLGIADTQVFGGTGFSLLKMQLQAQEGVAKIVDGVLFGVRGCRLLLTDIGSAGRLFWRAVSVRDLLAFVPFAIILIIPMTPVGHVLVFGFIQRYFPSFFPSQFSSRRQELMIKYEELKAQLNMAQLRAEAENDEIEFQRAAAAAAAKLQRKEAAAARAAAAAAARAAAAVAAAPAAGAATADAGAAWPAAAAAAVGPASSEDCPEHPVAAGAAGAPPAAPQRRRTGYESEEEGPAQREVRQIEQQLAAAADESYCEDPLDSVLGE